jgi:hypothetical protein
VGRAFPLCLLCPVPQELQSVPWGAWLPFYADLLEAAELSLHAVVHEGLDAASVQTRHQGPHVSSLPALLHEAEQVLQQERIGEFAARVYAGRASSFWYALATLYALEGSQDVVLDAPTPEDFDLFVWLELLRHLPSAPRAPSVLWGPSCERALLMPHRPSTAAVAMLLDRAHASPQRWPLWTDRPEAVARARERLPAAVSKAVAEDASLRALVDALRQEATS